MKSKLYYVLYFLYAIVVASALEGLTELPMSWKMLPFVCKRNIRRRAEKTFGRIIRIMAKLLRKKSCRMRLTGIVCG